MNPKTILLQWISGISLKWEDLVIALLILGFIYLLRQTLEKLLFKIIRRFTGKMSKAHFEAIVKGFEKPTATWIGFLGLYLSYKYLSVHYPTVFLFTGDTPAKLMKSVTVICVAVGFYNLGDLYGNMLIKLDDKLNLNTSTLFKEMISKIVRGLIVILAAGMAASEFFDVNGFIAGLGIAGLAFAMAAQDTLGNMIAGAAIVVDRPYDLGDWILCEGIEGTVEELTFRSTRVRTVTQEIVYIPNSNMSKNPITNFTRRGFRRVDIQALLDFKTQPEQIESLQKQMETYLVSHEFVREEGVVVKLDQFSPYGLSFVVKCFVNTNVYAEYSQYKEQINLYLLSATKEIGIQMATPPGGGVGQRI